MADVKPIPDGYARVTPYLHVDGAAAAIEFYERVFGAKERMRMPGPDGKVGHAEILFDDAVVMLADEFPELGGPSPKTLGGSAVTISLYVEDVDAVFAAALAEGATAISEPEDQFYGDRSGQVEDPFGHRWNLATHVEDVPPDEMERRMAAMMGG